MKFLFLAYLGLGVLLGQTQVSSRLLATQSTPAGSPQNVMWCNNSDLQRMYVSSIDSLKVLINVGVFVPANVSISTQTRSFNSNFKPSTTKLAWVTYSVSIVCTSTLIAGQTGTVFLEYSADGSTGWTEAGRTQASVSGVVSTNGQICQVSGFIPINYFVRLRTSGTGTITYISGQETLF